MMHSRRTAETHALPEAARADLQRHLDRIRIDAEVVLEPCTLAAHAQPAAPQTDLADRYAEQRRVAVRPADDGAPRGDAAPERRRQQIGHIEGRAADPQAPAAARARVTSV